VLGLGRDSVAAIPTDGAGHISVAALADAIDADVAAGIMPIAVVAVAGATDTGTVDPIAALAAVAHERGCWVHVDGAYGLIANVSAALAPLFAGVADADSWIVDPHKWLATGVGVGAVYVRDGGVLTRAFAEGHADYLEGAFAGSAEVLSEFDDLGGDWADQSVELSSPPRGAQVWAVLREIGREGVSARVEHHVGLARALAERVEAHPRLELLMKPELSVVCFRYLPVDADCDLINTNIVTTLRRTTRLAPSSTVVAGHVAIRPCFINPRQTMAEVDELVAEVVRIGDSL
jgi:aromatic-L-amino-acid decarboxylase